MTKICIIPARAGSKRILKKNIRLFKSKPIISYSILSALNCKLFDEIMVSTDCPEIKEIALKYGAKVPFLRSAKNSDDYASTYDVIDEVLSWYKKNDSIFKYVCCIYPCVPFLTEEKIINSFNLLKKNNFNSVFPVIKYSHPIQRAIKRNKNNFSFVNIKKSSGRTQDFDNYYHDSGQFYWLKTQNLLKEKSLVSSKNGCIILSELETQDIDNEMDWKLAELKYDLMQSIKN